MKLKQVFHHHSFFIILSIIIIVLFASLGTWQLFRLKQKTDYVNLVETQMTQPAVKLQSLLDEGLPLNNYKFRKVTVTGTFDKTYLNYLQAQVRDGKLGVNAILPMKMADGTVILVNLGWVNKNDVDQLQISDQLSIIEGYLKVSDKPNRFTPNNKIALNQLYYIDTTEFAKIHGIPTLLPLYLVATHFNPTTEYIKNNDATIHFQNVHLSYALTWYSLGIAWAILVWLYQRRKYLKRQNIPLLNELTPDKKIDSK